MSLGNIRQPEFGQRLRTLRESSGLSQRDLAGDVVDPSYISLLESGARVPTLKVVVRLGQVLGVSLQELVGPVAEPTQSTGDQRNERLVSDILARSSLDFGDLPEAQARFATAYATARANGELTAALEYGMALQEILALRAAHGSRYDLLADLVPLAEQLGVPELSLTIEVSRAAAARDTNQLAEALRLAEHAATGIERTLFADTAEHVRALGVLISTRCESDRTDRLREPIESMLTIAEKLDSSAILGRAHWAASVAFAALGEAEQARRQVRYAKEKLATPATSLREWARFSRAAASTLLDVDADIAEVEQFVRGAQATLSMVDVPGETGLLRLLQARYALATDDPRGAIAAVTPQPTDLRDPDLITLRLTLGRALHQLGRTDDALEMLRSAARLSEKLELFKRTVRIWRELDDLRPSTDR